MTDHYFADNPKVKSEEQSWEYLLKGHVFQFTTDRGVFSKGEVDFGSRLLVEHFIEPKIEGNLIDVGCGYGPIGLALARATPERMVHMVDINERAVGLSRKNASQNKVDNVLVYKSNGFENVTEKDFAAVITNPPIRAGKKIVHEILERAYQYLALSGTLWVVIQKKQGAPSAQNKMKSLFGNVKIVGKKKGYYILSAKKID